MSSQSFVVRTGGAERAVKVTAQGGGRYEVTLEGEKHSVDARRFVQGTWSLLIDDQSFDVELAVVEDLGARSATYDAMLRGRVVRLTVEDERHAKIELGAHRFRAEGPVTVVTPMPGKVVKILKAPGDEVAEGEPLVIVEAMKMENELRAPRAGKVAALFVAEGQTVEGGTRLLSVE